MASISRGARWASRRPRMAMSTTRCARDRASAADQSTLAEERVILAGVSDRAAVAGRTHKHPAKVPLRPSRNRPVSASRQCVCQQQDDSSAQVSDLRVRRQTRGAARCKTKPRPVSNRSRRDLAGSCSPAREGRLKSRSLIAWHHIVGAVDRGAPGIQRRTLRLYSSYSAPKRWRNVGSSYSTTKR